MMQKIYKKWNDCFQYRRCLLKRHRMWFDKGINIEDISTEPASKQNITKNLINKSLFASDFLISSFRKIARYTHSLISVANPRSNAVPWNVDYERANVACERGQRILISIPNAHSNTALCSGSNLTRKRESDGQFRFDRE